MADSGGRGRKTGDRFLYGAMAALSLFLIYLLAGCGGGGDSPSSPTPSAPSGSQVVARAYLSGPESASVRVTWNLPTVGGIIEHQILRDGEVVGVVPAVARTFDDSTRPNTVTYSLPSADRFSLTRTTVEAPSVTFGAPHQYQVRTLYSVSTPTATVYWVAFFSGTSGKATLLTRPSVISITDLGQIIAESAKIPFPVSVQFTIDPAATSYVIEFADNADFRNKKVKGALLRPFSPTTSFSSPALDLSHDFETVDAGARIYYRVGVRNSADNPGPLNEGASVPNADNYFYSPAADFRIAPSPSAAP